MVLHSRRATGTVRGMDRSKRLPDALCQTSLVKTSCDSSAVSQRRIARISRTLPCVQRLGNPQYGNLPWVAGEVSGDSNYNSHLQYNVGTSCNVVCCGLWFLHSLSAARQPIRVSESSGGATNGRSTSSRHPFRPARHESSR